MSVEAQGAGGTHGRPVFIGRSHQPQAQYDPLGGLETYRQAARTRLYHRGLAPPRLPPGGQAGQTAAGGDQPLLKTRVVGSKIVHLEETGSTADEARLLIDNGAEEGTVVIAESQSSGRGRLGRAWQTPPGQAIALSVVLYPTMSPTQVPLLSLATGLAVSASRGSGNRSGSSTWRSNGPTTSI